MDALPIRFETERFFEGLANRIEASAALASVVTRSRSLKPSEYVDAAASNQLSLFHAALVRQKLCRGRSRRPESDLLWYVLNTSCSHQNIRQQQNYISNIASRDEWQTVMPLAVGCTFISAHFQLPSFREHSPEDYSLLQQSHLFANLSSQKRNHRAFEYIIKTIPQFRERIGLPPLRRFSDATGFFAKLGCAQQIQNMQDLVQALAQAKRAWWPVIGADVFSSLQALCHYDHELDAATLNRMLFVLKLWQMDSFAMQIIALRAISGRIAEGDYVRAHAQEVMASLHPRLVQDTSRCVAGEKFGPIEFNLSEHLSRTIVRFLQIYRSIGRKSAAETKYWVIKAYEHDPFMIGFLDWRRIKNLVTTQLLVPDEGTAFLMLLMGEPQIRQRFPIVAFTTGRGAFISDLHSLLRAPNRRIIRNIFGLLAKFRRLPAKARRRVTLELLQKSVLERLANHLFVPQTFTSTLKIDFDTKVSALRIDAARAARLLNVIDQPLYENITNYEIAQLRMLLFRSIMLHGRVQIDWEALKSEVDEQLGDQINFLSLRELKGEKVEFPQKIFDSIVDYISREIALLVLIDSAASVDQALSNNLRHGVLLPRFLRAFQDAYGTLQEEGSNQEWSDNFIVAQHDSAGGAIVQLRNNVSELIRRFVEEDLRIVAPSPLIANASKTIASSLRSHIIGKKQKRISCGVVLDDIKSSTSDFVRGASSKLNEEIWPAINSEIERAKEKCSTSQTRHFLDSLEVNLDRALEEASKWINIAQVQGHVNQFSIDEIVSVELVSTQTSHSERLRVRCASADERLGDVRMRKEPHQIDGRYLEFFQEALHNLLSNAFKYSGLGLQTQVNIEFRTTSNGFLLRCENSASERRMTEIRKTFSQIAKLAASDAPRRAKLSKVSGFQRVKVLGRRTFKATPRINIPPVSKSQNRFLAEVTVKFEPGVLADAQGASDRR